MSHDRIWRGDHVRVFSASNSTRCFNIIVSRHILVVFFFSWYLRSETSQLCLGRLDIFALWRHSTPNGCRAGGKACAKESGCLLCQWKSVPFLPCISYKIIVEMIVVPWGSWRSLEVRSSDWFSWRCVLATGIRVAFGLSTSNKVKRWRTT